MRAADLNVVGETLRRASLLKKGNSPGLGASGTPGAAVQPDGSPAAAVASSLSGGSDMEGGGPSGADPTRIRSLFYENQHIVEPPKPPFLAHESQNRIIWDITLLMFVLYNGILVPVELADLVAPSLGLGVISILIDLAFVVDLAINFVTPVLAKHSRTVWIKDKPTLAVKYFLSGWFAADFLASFPFGASTSYAKHLLRLLLLLLLLDVASRFALTYTCTLLFHFRTCTPRLYAKFANVSGLHPHFALYTDWVATGQLIQTTSNDDDVAKGVSLIRTAKLSRLLRSLRLLRLIRFFRVQNKTISAMGNLLRLLGVFALGLHCLACFYLFISSAYADEGRSWYWNFVHATPEITNAKIYFQGLYVSMLMLCGNDVFPVVQAEVVVATFGMLAGAVFQATLFGKMAQLIVNLNEKNARRKTKFSTVRQHLLTLQIDNLELCERVEEYYKYLWQVCEFDFREAFFSELSPPLRSELNMAINGM